MSQDQPRKTQKNPLFRLRPVMRWAINLRSTPRAIAGGLGLGTFIAFTPTMGVQLILALVVATAFSMNRPAALIPVWITNPITVVPIYSFAYWLGDKIWSGPPLAEVTELFKDIAGTMTHLEFWEIKEQILAVLKMGWDVLIPLFIGGSIIGIVTGIVVYIATLKLLSFFFTRRAQKRLLNHRPAKKH